MTATSVCNRMDKHGGEGGGSGVSQVIKTKVIRGPSLMYTDLHNGRCSSTKKVTYYIPAIQNELLSNAALPVHRFV